ncbi:hypothetical protein FOPG_20124, partial [Fusarium oxysporum f. sp. conglutinans race 2 54008]
PSRSDAGGKGLASLRHRSYLRRTLESRPKAFSMFKMGGYVTMLACSAP